MTYPGRAETCHSHRRREASSEKLLPQGQGNGKTGVTRHRMLLEIMISTIARDHDRKVVNPKAQFNQGLDVEEAPIPKCSGAPENIELTPSVAGQIPSRFLSRVHTRRDNLNIGNFSRDHAITGGGDDTRQKPGQSLHRSSPGKQAQIN